MLSNFLIALTTTLLIAALSRIEPVRTWLRSARTHPLVTLLLVLMFVSLFLTVEAGARLKVTDIDHNRLARILLLLGLAAFSGLGIVLRLGRMRLPGLSILFMMVFSLFAMLSYFYSVNPILSLWKGFEVFASVLVFTFFVTRVRTIVDVENILNTLWLILLVLVVSALVGGVYEPSMAFVRQLGGLGGRFAFEYWGVFPQIHPNSLSQWGALLGAVGICYALSTNRPGDRLSALFVSGLGLAALLLAHSRTSLIALVVALAVVFIAGKRKTLGLGLALLAAILMSIPQIYETVEGYVVRGQTQQAFKSLSGRTEYWPIVLDVYSQSPIIGHGYYAGHRQYVSDGRVLLSSSSVDNTYLEVLVDLGIVGLLFIVGAILAVGLNLLRWKAGTVPEIPENRWNAMRLSMLSLFVIVMVRSFTGPTFQVLHPNLILFLALALTSSIGAHAVRYLPRKLATGPARDALRPSPHGLPASGKH